MNFELSVSNTTSTQKPKGMEIARLQFQRKSINLDIFVDYIKEGRTFCYVFTDNDIVFGNNVKTISHFMYTNVVALDVDDSTAEMNDYVATLLYKPTVAYTTYSNGCKGYRFRLVYVFNDKIISTNEYQAVYKAIVEANNMNLSDNCMYSVNQCFIGNGSDAVEVVRNDVVYNKSMFDLTRFDIRDNKANETKKRSEQRVNSIVIDESFKNDLQMLKRSDFLLKYVPIYKVKEQTDFLWDDYERYGVGIYDRDSHVQIYRQWERVNGVAQIHKWHNGEGRRKHLYMSALTFKRIFDNDITIEHLVYLLARELENYYINDKKDYITDADLIHIANNALNSEYDAKVYCPHKYKIVNKQIWHDKGYNAIQAANIYRRIKRDEVIGSMWDGNLSDKQNAEYMNANATDPKFHISVDGLKAWRKRQGIKLNRGRKSASNSEQQKGISVNKKEKQQHVINRDTLLGKSCTNLHSSDKTSNQQTKKELFVSLYNENLSDIENLKNMNDCGLDIKRRTYYNYKKSLKNNHQGANIQEEDNTHRKNDTQSILMMFNSSDASNEVFHKKQICIPENFLKDARQPLVVDASLPL